MAAGGGKEMEIAIKIAGKVESSFKNALSQATKGLGTITKTVASAAAAAAAAVGAMGIAAINTGREFEGAMSQVAATMLIDKTTAEGQKAFETLENAARECGASTAFSATEAAEALNYLALAGYDADKAATALPTVLKLAGAGAMDLAAASDMVTDSMSALGIEATKANLTQFSDQLAQTASKANTSVAQLGEAILTVGGTAKGLAGGTTELNTALGILADNGLKGAEGGTHLRNIILSLQNPTDKAAASLQKMGVDVYDVQGNMRGLNDVFKDLQGAMDGMDNASKDTILSTLFNKTDLTAANAMLANCTDRFDELSASIENSAGACKNMYAIQLDNLNGDIDILKSGLSDLGISIYQDLNGSLREMTQLATSMVGELSEAYKSGGMEGMVGAVGGCMAEVVNTIADYAPQVVSMGVDLLENFISGITDNSGTLATAASEVITVFVEGLFTLVPQVILAGIDILTQFVQSMTAQLQQRNAGNRKLCKWHYTAAAGGHIDGTYAGSDPCKQHRTERPHAYKRSYSAYREFSFRHSFHASPAYTDGNPAYFEFGAGDNCKSFPAFADGRSDYYKPCFRYNPDAAYDYPGGRAIDYFPNSRDIKQFRNSYTSRNTNYTFYC